MRLHAALGSVRRAHLDRLPGARERRWDPDRDSDIMLTRLIRTRIPDAPLPAPDIRELDQALAATSLLARQAAEVLPAFSSGEESNSARGG